MSRIWTKARAALPLAAVVMTLAAGPRPAGAAGPLEYNRDIRPILSENCFRCHGPDSASRKANLRLDKREAAVEAGAIVPNDPDASELIERVFTHDRDLVMPPPAAKKTLADTEKDRLRRWITEGAAYQPHWSFLAPKKPAPPTVKDNAWPKNPIDRFLLAEIERRGMKPSPEADRQTLARRLALDLTGLPPDPADVEAFVADTSPNAYETLVDKYLASPRWGEHRGRYWLDAARYADTHGIHFDNYREMWIYRDWVIDAFNKNMPFDTFSIEQIAGDLLPGRTLEQQIASGFNRCNITTNEGGAISEEYQVLYTRDRTETVSQVFMGLTAGCAVCHDHKFDPLSQKEFYELAAFFNNTTQAAMDGNVKDTPPSVFVPLGSDRARWAALVGERSDLARKLVARQDAARPDFEKFLSTSTAAGIAAKIPAASLKLNARLDDRDAAAVPPRGPGALLELADVGDFEKDQPFSFGAWIKPLKKNSNGAVLARMDDGRDFRGWDLYMDRNRVGAHVISKWPTDAMKVMSKAPLKEGRWSHVLITYDGSGKAAGLKVHVDGQVVAADVEEDRLKGSIRADAPLKVGQRKNSSRIADQVLIGDVRVYARSLSGGEAGDLVAYSRAATLLEKPAEKRDAGAIDDVFRWWFATNDVASKSLREGLARLDREKAAIEARGTVAHVMNERPEPPMAFLLFRGDYDKRRDPVKADTPDILPPLPSDLPKNRLGLAKWLFLPEHPLTARVTVNRFWQELFGNGLVRTSGDFGVSGELPSHPELLDWLAVEFRDGGWNVKKFFKLMVMSAAYRQSEAATFEAIEKDPQNRYLARGPRYRMDAEMVRDHALAASGLLAGKIGGPSVRPYQPEGVWEAVAMPESNTRNYKRDSGESLYRRSLYTFWKRAAPPASMDIFNAPNRETCAVRRERTNTPLQALVTLNDTQFVEAARALAERTLKSEAPSINARLDAMALRLVARRFRPEEARVVRSSLDALIAHYQAHPDDAKKLIAVGERKPDPALNPATLAAWTMLANELMNLDEVLNK